MRHRHFIRRRGRGERLLVICVLAAFAALAFGGCGRAPEQPATATTGVSADQVLRVMSETLAKSPRLTFKVTRQLDAALVEGRELPESAQIEVAVARPNKVMARSTSAEDVRRFYADGQNVSLYDEKMNLYATVPSMGSIDEMVARLDDGYGFTPPLAELMLNDPYAKMSKQIQSSTHAGMETIDGVNCHHVTATGALADADIWVAAQDHLPRRLVVTYKEREGSPKLRADFSEWNLSAKLDDQTFSFVAPKEAEKIEMLTSRQIAEAEQKGGKKPGQKK